VPLAGEKPTGFELKTLETIAEGGEVTVSRQMNRVWVDDATFPRPQKLHSRGYKELTS
jgi:hypothetical protein